MGKMETDLIPWFAVVAVGSATDVMWLWINNTIKVKWVDLSTPYGSICLEQGFKAAVFFYDLKWCEEERRRGACEKFLWSVRLLVTAVFGSSRIVFSSHTPCTLESLVCVNFVPIWQGNGHLRWARGKNMGLKGAEKRRRFITSCRGCSVVNRVKAHLLVIWQRVDEVETAGRFCKSGEWSCVWCWQLDL